MVKVDLRFLGWMQVFFYMIMENVGRVFLCKNIQIFMHFCIKCIYALIEMFLGYRIGCKGAVLGCGGG